MIKVHKLQPEKLLQFSGDLSVRNIAADYFNDSTNHFISSANYETTTERLPDRPAKTGARASTIKILQTQTAAVSV